MEKTTQRAEVLNYLKEHGSITSMEAFQLFGVTRLSAIIFDLRKKLREQGEDIVTETEVTVTRYGQRTRYGRYVYIPKERK